MIDAEKLNALVDNELDPQERAELEAAIAQDPKAAAEIGSIRALKSALQDYARPVACEDEWKGCVKRLNEIDRAKTTRKVVDRWAWAMCSCLFAFIVVAGMYNRSNPSFRASTGDLTRASMGVPLHDVSSALRWAKGVFGKTPALPPQQLHAVEAWTGTYNDSPLARIHLKDAKGDLWLLMVKGNVVVENVSPMDDGRHFAGQMGSANSVAWTAGDVTMILSGDREVGELRDIADVIPVS